MAESANNDDWGSGEAVPILLTPAEWVLVKNASTDAGLRASLVRELTKLFVRLNAALFAGLACIVVLEAALVYSGLEKPADRIVTSQVVMALIAATAALLGFGIAAMIAYLFPRKAPAQHQRPSDSLAAPR